MVPTRRDCLILITILVLLNFMYISLFHNEDNFMYQFLFKSKQISAPEISTQSQFATITTQFATKTLTNSKILLMILSSDESRYQERRNNIRSGYLSHPWKNKANYSHVFLVSSINKSSDIITENEIHKDFMWYPYPDDYYKLSTKVWWGFQYALLSSKFQYIVKLDDDTVVSIDRVFNHIYKKHKSPDLLYSGTLRHKRRFRDQEQLEHAPGSLFKFGNTCMDEYFIDPIWSCQGGCYVMSREVVKRLLRIHLTKPTDCEVMLILLSV